MDYAEQLRILSAAQGDPAALALALVDLTFHAEPAEERAALRAALEAAAIPHWITPALLAALLGIAESAAAARLARLRQLTVVEPFPGRGEGACNVHEQARFALRRRLAEQEPERFRTLSARAAKAFADGRTPAKRIEHAGHLAIAEPARGAMAFQKLREEWQFGGRFEEAQALAAACEELIDLPGLAAEGRAMLLLNLAWLRENHQPAEQLLPLLREAVSLYRELKDEWRLGQSLTLFGDALANSGQPEEARGAHEESLRVKRRLAPALDAVTLDTATEMRNVSVSLNRLGELDGAQGRPEEARKAFTEGLEIRRRLAALDPNNTNGQRDVSVSLERLGEFDRKQGRPEEARKAFAEGLDIRRRLAALDPANTEWQRDVSISLDRLGELDRAQGRPKEARKIYAEGLDIRRRLVALDPANILWQRDVNYSLHMLGRLLLDEGRVREAVPLFTEALGIAERLAALDPQNVIWHQAVRANRHWLAEARRAPGEEPGASV